MAARKRAHYDRTLTLAAVQAAAAASVGTVLELRGTVGGSVETADGVSIMLNLPDRGSVTLDVPPSEVSLVKDYVTPNIRVLVRVAPGSSGNVAVFTVIAMAHESTVHAIETAEAARAAAIARQSSRRAGESDARVQRRSGRGLVSSRGEYLRSGNRNTQDRALINAYEPYLAPRARHCFAPYYEFIRSVNGRLRNEEAASIAYHLIHFAERYDVDPRLVVAMIMAESGFNPSATSRSGAMGLGQLMPGTARALGVEQPYNLAQNLYGSVKYLHGRLSNFQDHALPNGGMSFEQAALAMAAYNAGPNAVRKYGGVPPYRETRTYVRRVMDLYRQLSGK